MKNIDIRKLKESVNILLDQVIASGIEQVPLANQFYWDIVGEDKYNMTKEPVQLAVGDLFDDLEFTEQVSQNIGQQAIYTLTEIAPILAYVGESLSRGIVE